MNRKILATFLGACAVAFATAALAAGEFTVVHTFKGGSADGDNPHGSLTPDGLGNLYGTTAWGGRKACASYGCGTVYRIGADGTFTIVYAFTGGKDGGIPGAGLTLSPDGSFYGSTTIGTIYRLTPDGQISVIYTFAGDEDGESPSGNLVLDKKGNLYGVTTFGGHYSLGTLFRITPRGKEIQLHAFAEDQTDGGEPTGGVVVDKAGNLFGTTPWGGSNYSGTIFKVTPQGEYSVFYNFAGGAAGEQPRSELMIDKDGNFYGTTSAGGDYGYGTGFKLSPSGTESVLYSFKGHGSGDGAEPQSGVIADRQGNLYGTTTNDGGTPRGPGIVYKLAPDGTETVLHAFTGGKDGTHVATSLVADGVGNLYGAAEDGGYAKRRCYPYGCGTIFRVTPN